MEAVGSITGMEYLQSDSEVPKLIDFFKSEMPLLHDRHMGKQEFLCKRGNQKWSTIPTLVSASPECAIADGEERQMEPILVDFFKGGNGARNGDSHHHGVDAAVLKRSSSAGEVKYPMAKMKEAVGEHWSLQMANPLTALKILSPTPTGTEESGTAAPKTPSCDMEIAYSRPCPNHNEYSAQQGSTFSSDSGQVRVDGSIGHREIRNLHSGDFEVSADSGTSHGWKRLRRITPLAPPLMRSEALEQTPTSHFRDIFTQTQFSDPLQRCSVLEAEDEETEALVQAATSLLSLASNEGASRHRRPEFSSTISSEHEPEVDGDGRISIEACSSVLSRPSNKRRYRLVIDVLADSPNVT